ncbi:MAG: DNA polymerase I [Elusimicrobia bacterium ADurb.Bin231]|nr:MAG: DNA polymerase I [Elusimicrobia bacterium ADurb.Bin231]
MSLFLIDGNSYIHRAYHAIRYLTTSQGIPVNAVFGFTKMLLKIIKENNPDKIAVCFDSPKKTFRHNIYSDYKAKRKKTDEALKSQFALVKEVLCAMNIKYFEMEGYEADDILATIAEKSSTLGENVTIVTSDKDVLQLVNDKINVLNEPLNILYDRKKIIEKWGIPPENITDYLSLAGDASDNVPGVACIGEKTATKLIKEFGDIENIHKNADLIPGRTGKIIKSSHEKALFSKKLVTLVKDIPMMIELEDLKYKSPNTVLITEVFKKFEFYSLLHSISVPSDLPVIQNDPVKVIPCNGVEEVKNMIASAGEYSLSIELNKTTDMLYAAFCSEPGIVYYTFFSKTELFSSQKGLSFAAGVSFLEGLLKDANLLLIGHGIKTMFSALEKFGVPIYKYINDEYIKLFDTEIAAYLLDPSKKRYSLDDLSVEYLSSGICSKTSDTELLYSEEIKNDLCCTANLIYKLKTEIEKKLSENNLLNLFFEIEMPLMNVLYSMESNGILIDNEYFKRLSSDFAKELEIIEEKIYDCAGEKFNINSPRQISAILFGKIGLKPARRNKTGFSTDESVLLSLSDKHELPGLILSYREISKLKSTFVDSLIQKADPNSLRVHTSLNQAGTSTGRLSSSEPNLQNIPVKTEIDKKIRHGFIPSRGNILASFDYSQIDLRVLAHITGDEILKSAFINGKDVHSITASEIFGVPVEDVTSEMRKRAKGINFGIVYGQQAWGLSKQLGISTEEAQGFIDKYFLRYNGVKRWIGEIIETARKNGYVKTLRDRMRFLPEINSENAQSRMFAERVAINTPIQGSSADIIKIAMIKVFSDMRSKDTSAKMLLQVHDELLFEIPEKDITSLVPVIKTGMEDCVKLDIPIVVDVKCGYNWADLKIYEKK